MNPARAKLLSAKQPLSAFRWSSYPEYLKGRAARPSWLRVDRLLGEHGIPKDSPAGREQFERRMELRRAAGDGPEFGALLRGWCVGSEELLQELQARMRAGPEHARPESPESERGSDRRVIEAALNKL